MGSTLPDRNNSKMHLIELVHKICWPIIWDEGKIRMVPICHESSQKGNTLMGSTLSNRNSKMHMIEICA